VQISLGPGPAGVRDRADVLLRAAHRQAAWRILTERLEALADRADRLSESAGLGQLTSLTADLHGMARDIQSA
jgi:hypothetical protein